MGWVSPTSFTDPDSVWNNEEQAYNGSTSSGADSPNGSARTWGSYIELNIASISCDTIRFNALYNAADINSISVDVYYSSAWNNIFEGIYVHNTWEEKAIGSTENVTAARVMFYAKKTATAYLYELEFNEVAAEPQQYQQGISGGITFMNNMNNKSIFRIKIGTTAIARKEESGR